MALMWPSHSLLPGAQTDLRGLLPDRPPVRRGGGYLKSNQAAALPSLT